MRASQQHTDSECFDLTAMSDEQAYIVGQFIVQELYSSDASAQLRLPKNVMNTLLSSEGDIAFTLKQDVTSHRLVKDNALVGFKVTGDEELGRGIFGAVKVVIGSLHIDAEDDYKASFEMHHSLAIKKIKQKETDTRKAFGENVMREVTLSQQTDYLHFKKPTFFETRKDKKNVAGEKLLDAYIIIKRFHGKTLQAHIAANDLTTMQIAAISRLLPHCLQKDCHEKFVLHRDIKPDNIIVNIDENGEVINLYYIDLGLARDIRIEDHKNCGAAAFVSPEQLCRELTNEKSDIYSLGKLLIILWKLLSKSDSIVSIEKFFENVAKSNNIIIITSAFISLGLSASDSIKAENMMLSMTQRSPRERPKNLMDVSQCFKQIEDNLAKVKSVSAAKATPSFFVEASQQVLMERNKIKEEIEEEKKPRHASIEI